MTWPFGRAMTILLAVVCILILMSLSLIPVVLFAGH